MVNKEIKAANDVVPFARARYIINQVGDDDVTEDQLKALLELMVWAYEFDRQYDWTWNMRDCPLLGGLSSYHEAVEVVEGWFGNNQFPINERFQEELNVFETWILPALEVWVEQKLDEYLNYSTWKGVKGVHAVHWDPEKHGHVVVFKEDDFEPVFDHQL